MAIFRKNIWTIFYSLIVSSFVFLCLISYIKWENLHEQYAQDQTHLVKLVSNSMHALLLSQESTLDILGHQLLKEKNSELLDDLLVLNPSIIAYGFTDINGTYLYVNSKFDKTKLPNLRHNPLTKDSFEYTLTQRKMVLGRTYYIPGGARWGIPIRKAIFDKDGNPKGVMTAGLNIEGAFRLFSENISLGTFNQVTFLRDRDKFVQYRSRSATVPKETYESAFLQNFFSAITKKLTIEKNVSLQNIKKSQKIYLTEVYDESQKILEQVAIKYDPRYELWTISSINHKQLVDDFIENFSIYLFIFFLINIITFLLFNIISHAERKRRNDLIYEATHDSLTTLPNRNYLKQEIHNWIYEGAPPFSMYYIDMDHFKNINDSFGHEYGDLLLIEFSKRLLNMVRNDSIVIREGGDEFIILTYRTDTQEILAHTQKILDAIAASYKIHHLSFIVGASIGIARYPEHGETLDMLLRASDIAMYEAKKQKNSICLFVQDMQKSYLNRLNLEQALHQALKENEFFMVYQPQLDQNGVIYGIEALVRWQHPQMGLIPPDEFISIAETSGIMPKLGDFILTKTLSEIKCLQEELNISFQTSINISVKQFMENNFLEKLFKKIENANLKQISLCLEITENLFIEDIDYIIPILEQIHEMGLSISMDDFGTGYSSLSMLRELPIDELKIDKSFVQKILEDIPTRKMIQSIITIGKNLDLFIIAEGVEEKEQEELLKTFGCDRFQGYLYSKPLPYEKLKDFLKDTFQTIRS
jgi:diguanylate cyclase (GGDEF)-like protein